MTKKKIVKKIYQFLRLKLKRNLGNIRLIRRLKRKHVKRVSELNKKKFNFVLVDDFIRENSCGKIYENVDGYDINLYELDNAYISNCLNCAFVQKISNDELYTFKESAGVIARLDEPCMNYAPPFDLKNITPIEEDEVCLLCYLLGENYWHYIFDIIPRLMIMIKRGYKGKFLVNNTWCARQFMELLKIPTDRLIINQYGLVIKAKKVYLYSEMYGIELSGSLLSDTRNYLISEVEKNYGKLEDKTFPKRIYVSRVARRKIINEAEIIELLEDKGFKVVIPEKTHQEEPLKVQEEAPILLEQTQPKNNSQPENIVQQSDIQKPIVNQQEQVKESIPQAPVPAVANKVYKVYVGSYSTPAQAEVAKGIISEANIGVSTFIKNLNGTYTLQAGSYSSADKAQAAANDLLKNNFPARVVAE